MVVSTQRGTEPGDTLSHTSLPLEVRQARPQDNVMLMLKTVHHIMDNLSYPVMSSFKINSPCYPRPKVFDKSSNEVIGDRNDIGRKSFISVFVSVCFRMFQYVHWSFYWIFKHLSGPPPRLYFNSKLLLGMHIIYEWTYEINQSIIRS